MNKGDISTGPGEGPLLREAQVLRIQKPSGTSSTIWTEYQCPPLNPQKDIQSKISQFMPLKSFRVEGIGGTFGSTGTGIFFLILSSSVRSLRLIIGLMPQFQPYSKLSMTRRW